MNCIPVLVKGFWNAPLDGDSLSEGQVRLMPIDCSVRMDCTDSFQSLPIPSGSSGQMNRPSATDSGSADDMTNDVYDDAYDAELDA